MTKRAHIPLKEKLAAALATMLRPDETGHFVPVIPYEDRKRMTADQVLSLFHFDHWPIRHADDGPGLHFNLKPRFIAEHREKTARVDVPQIAKRKRIVTKEQEHARRMMLRSEPKDDRQNGKLKSRGFDKRFRKKMSGAVVRREVE